MENKLVVLHGKLVEIKDTLITFKAAASEAPLTNLSEIFERLNTLENIILKIEPISPATQPASEPTPSPAPSSMVAPRSAVEADMGALTMKDKVRKIIEELVTASAITIASRLQVSTAMFRSVLKELEDEGVVVLSGDIESGRFEVRLA